MSTAAELLAVAYIGTSSDSADEENIFTISEDLRTITIPEGQEILGVESDDKVRRIWFKAPRECDGLDLGEFKLWINYRNAANVLDRYEVLDATVLDDRILFSWLVGRTAFAAHGEVLFNVCMRLYADDAETVLREFNTTLASMIVLEGLEADPVDTSDYIDAWNSFMAGARATLDAAASAADDAAAGAIEAMETVQSTYEAAEAARQAAYEQAEAGRDAAAAGIFNIDEDGALYLVCYDEEA